MYGPSWSSLISLYVIEQNGPRVYGNPYTLLLCQSSHPPPSPPPPPPPPPPKTVLVINNASRWHLGFRRTMFDPVRDEDMRRKLGYPSHLIIVWSWSWSWPGSAVMFSKFILCFPAYQTMPRRRWSACWYICLSVCGVRLEMFDLSIRGYCVF